MLVVKVIVKLIVKVKVIVKVIMKVKVSVCDGRDCESEFFSSKSFVQKESLDLLATEKQILFTRTPLKEYR